MNKPDRETVYALLEEITQTPGLSEAPQTELMESNILDSLSFLLFLECLDDRFGIELQPTQALPAVWKTPQSVADYLLNL